MEFISDESYEYIKSKYTPMKKMEVIDEDGVKHFNNAYGMERFTRVDKLFDESTGLDGDLIKRMILEEDAKITHLPTPVRKAKALKLVLENTRIRCDSRDLFPAINCVDRPLDATVVQIWRKEILEGLVPEVNDKRIRFTDEGIATIWPDYCHTVPIFERLLGFGFSGLLEESEKARRVSENTEKEEAFFEGIKLTYEAIIAFTARLADEAERSAGCEKLAKALRNLTYKAPESFYEACLIAYLYFMISEHVDGIQVRSLSNFDRVYYPYWQKDLEGGKSEEELKHELAQYLMQFMGINNYWGQPVYLGGTKADGTTEINPLSYIFLEVYDKLNLLNPKIQLKASYKTTPKEFLLKALDMIRRGNNSIVFVCEETMVAALKSIGFTDEEARLAHIHGCYEYSVQGALGCGMNYVNLLKPLEYALHQGRDGVTGKFSGLECKRAEDFLSFEEFYGEYKRQLKYIIESVIEIVNGFEDYLSDIDPLSMLAPTFPSSLEKKRDPIAGGGVSNRSGMPFGFIAEICDSLAMIKKYVFDKKELSLAELRDALDKNYEGNEKLRAKLLLDPDKFGNNMELPDSFAVDITDFIASQIHGKPNASVRGDSWGFLYHVARQSYDQAPKTASAPNGRLIGDELSKNCSATMGQNKQGATAAILSTTKIDAVKVCSDVPLDLGLLPSAVQGEDGLEAMHALLQTFMRRGGHALHINVFSPEILRAAQKNPEKYKDLQIRVCGWNVLFNDIIKPEQDGFIRQAESLI